MPLLEESVSLTPHLPLNSKEYSTNPVPNTLKSWYLIPHSDRLNHLHKHIKEQTSSRKYPNKCFEYGKDNLTLKEMFRQGC